MKTRIINSGATMGLIVAAMLLLASCQSKAIESTPSNCQSSYIYYNKCSNDLVVHGFPAYEADGDLEIVFSIKAGSYIIPTFSSNELFYPDPPAPWQYYNNNIDSVIVSNGTKQIVYKGKGNPLFSCESYQLLYHSTTKFVFGWTFTDDDFKNAEPAQ